MPELSPMVLLARVQQGDENALAELVHRFRKPLQCAAGKMVGRSLRPHLDSDDLIQSVQQTLLVGLRAGKFDISSVKRFFALALTLVRRSIARQWRVLKRQPGVADRAPVGAGLAARESLNDDPAASFERASEVESVLAGLDFTDRRLLELRLQGYTTAEVARTTGLDAGYLRVRLIRLRKRLTLLGYVNPGNAAKKPTLVARGDHAKDTPFDAAETLVDVPLPAPWGDAPIDKK